MNLSPNNLLLAVPKRNFCVDPFCCLISLSISVLASPFHCAGNMSLVMRKPAFCICENKDADQLRGNREADQRLYFRYTDSTIPLLPKSEISRL